MVNRYDNSYVSVRMCSKIIQSTESGNGENLLGAYLSDGATYVYRSGKEYENIFPVWNWHRIPGVTSYTEAALPSLSWQGLHNQSDFVGGVSDSVSGIACMLFKRDGLTAYKSWFFTSQGFTCLGTGIRSDLKEDVSTTVNQNLLNGKIIVKTNKGSRLISEGEQLKGENISWVYHDHTGYLFLQKEKVEVSADHQSGNWNRVYHAGSSEKISKNVFNLSVAHGSNPTNESYAYMVLPNTSESILNHAFRLPLIKILQNDTCIQAISDASKLLTQIIFYREGKIRLNNKIILRANNPCLVIAKQSGKNLKLTVSTPPKIDKEIILTLNGRYQCADCIYNSDNDETKVKFNKLNGADAGKSISQMLISQ
jgi:chondroitin AC lyase